MLSVFTYIGMYMKDDCVNTFLLLDTLSYSHSTFTFECYCAKVQQIYRLLMFENLDKIQQSLSETYYPKLILPLLALNILSLKL